MESISSKAFDYALNTLSISLSQLNPPIIGSSPAAERLRKLVRKLADTTVSVLLTGESGVGKELLAKNLHFYSSRRSRPFVAVNCAALSAGILESELFGHGKGAFTGAIRSHAGLFEQANGGTLFLDEIGEIAPFIQAKLLRTLQEREVRRMGEAGVRRIDVRIICATNSNLSKKVREGLFREDLYYRINVVQIRIPPLRERLGDIKDFVEYFFRRQDRPPPCLSNEARVLLFKYSWPGNIRELENELERMSALYSNIQEITPGVLSERIICGEDGGPFDVGMFEDAPLSQVVEYLEERLVKKALFRSNWNKTQTARTLGLSRQGLIKKIKRYGIRRDSLVVSEDEPS